MNSSDKKQFAAVMNALACVYKEDLTETLLRLYFSTLEGMTIDELNYAAGAHMKKSKFFPKPSELLDIKRAADKENKEKERLSKFHIAHNKTPEEKQQLKITGNKALEEIKELLK